MVLSTHAVTGALIGAIASQNLALAASAAFVSHVLLDTIPHWDYKMASLEKKGVIVDNDMNTHGKRFFIDLAKIGFDFLLGLILVGIIFHAYSVHILIGAFVGAICAVAPDPLQFVYWKMRFTWLKPLQTFHMWMHAKTNLNDRPFLGISSQIVIILLVVIATHFLYK